jgi:hypothetical protein
MRIERQAKKATERFGVMLIWALDITDPDIVDTTMILVEERSLTTQKRFKSWENGLRGK